MTGAPTQIRWHRRSQILELHFGGEVFQLPAEYLRVFSPSAEVRGHGMGNEVLQAGKRDVGITAIEPQGNYAVKLAFTDGHASGIYSWDYLYALGDHYQENWQDYLERLNRAGASRDPDVAVVKIMNEPR